TYSPVTVLVNTNENHLLVYPNPANAAIEVIAPVKNKGKSSIILYDATGRQIISLIPQTGTNRINTWPLPAGIYILNILNDGITTAEKIIIQH
ncbi:MAG TPA: T9SS type A sorting domain-containing protein, partial [Chitinophagaceae bacterium]|nr:T9SS type A sorting domain-containing protein [Chitinophagaceae bacterium]